MVNNLIIILIIILIASAIVYIRQYEIVDIWKCISFNNLTKNLNDFASLMGF